MRSKISVCYASSDSYSPYMGVSLLSLLHNNADVVGKIYLLDFGITCENKAKIEEMVSKYNIPLIYVDAVNRMKKTFEHIGLPLFRGSYATYARAFISDLIDEKEGKLLYIDSDTVVDGKIDELVELDLRAEEKAYAAVIGVNQYTVGNEELRLDNGNDVYYACGVMMFDLYIWRKHKCTEQIASYIREHERDYRYADQTAINNVIDSKLAYALHPKYNYWGHIYKGKRVNYEMSRGNWWNSLEIEEAKRNPVIIHYKGHVVHPWLIGNISSLSYKYVDYMEVSPWKAKEMKTIYFDEGANCETCDFKNKVNKQIRQIQRPACIEYMIDKLVLIKRKMLGEFI